MTLSMRPRYSMSMLMLSLVGGFAGTLGCSSSTKAVIPKVVTPEMEQGLEEERRRSAELDAEEAAARKEREQSAKRR